ncbi:protein-S-isoprenylcysteine O-methyltransferase [Nitrobacter winogradskyi]|uniref:Protein-S-isoprenylcysteine O-methyltransferase Ste14 n=2 Tax=Nitrobacter winogradskyi TaxID=913 RepID=A0ACC6AE40_NITWI|nr:protein-S-isoprenylcysteine O-methyltransferase [Nitrobacter winogradskyi]MCP1998100.1 protein-S-isoprenylcysteine O-methyltransferase Ste14 [Nitrobacter winogradskyi]GEC15304.1 farnesyl cysteine carboxyl-methyltransferase [Nitrobacter winogradskyi]
MSSITLGQTIWLIGLVAWFIIRYPYARRARGTATLRRDGSRRERALLAAAFAGLFVIPIVNLATGWPRAFAYDPGYGLIVLGSLLFAFSLWLFRRSHKDLGRQWSASLEVREGHRVVRTGVYRLIRHPMYASFWLWAIAQAFLLPNVVAALSGVAAVALLFFARVRFEEQMMIETFGEDYRRYMQQTHRIIPGVY